MAGTTSAAAFEDAIRQSRRIQIITILWMGAEAALSLWAAGWQAVLRCWRLEVTVSLNCSPQLWCSYDLRLEGIVNDANDLRL